MSLLQWGSQAKICNFYPNLLFSTSSDPFAASYIDGSSTHIPHPGRPTVRATVSWMSFRTATQVARMPSRQLLQCLWQPSGVAASLLGVPPFTTCCTVCSDCT